MTATCHKLWWNENYIASQTILIYNIHIYLSLYNITNEFLLLEHKRGQQNICELFHLQHHLLPNVHFHSGHYDKLPVWPNYLTFKIFGFMNNNNTSMQNNWNLTICTPNFKILRNSVSIMTHPIFQPMSFPTTLHIKSSLLATLNYRCFTR
jgi:hypothetical protein